LTRWQRIGGVLLAPRATLLYLNRTRLGGFADAALLTLGLVVVTALPALVRAALLFEEQGARLAVALALSALLGGLAAPVVLVLVMAVVLSLAARRGRSGGRDLDLAALCTLPFVLLRACGGAVALASGIDVQRFGELAGLCGSAWILWNAIKAVREHDD